MGDGNLWANNKIKKGKRLYKITLCTDNFPMEDLEFIRDKLKDVYRWDFRINKADKGFRLTTAKYDIIKDFLFRTYSESVDCFSYKWYALNDELYDSGKKRWAKEQIEILRRDYPSLGTNIPSLLKQGLTKSAIKNMAVRYGTKHQKRFWSEEDKELVIKKFPELGTNIPDLKKKGYTKYAIEHMARKLGVIFNQFGKIPKTN